MLATRGRHSLKFADVFLGLGSNVGDRSTNLSQAIASLEENPEVRVVKKSSVHETAPVGDVVQGDFLNQVVQIETDLEPKDLLACC